MRNKIYKNKILNKYANAPLPLPLGMSCHCHGTASYSQHTTLHNHSQTEQHIAQLSRGEEVEKQIDIPNENDDYRVYRYINFSLVLSFNMANRIQPWQLYFVYGFRCVHRHCIPNMLQKYLQRAERRKATSNEKIYRVYLSGLGQCCQVVCNEGNPAIIYLPF